MNTITVPSTSEITAPKRKGIVHSSPIPIRTTTILALGCSRVISRTRSRAARPRRAHSHETPSEVAKIRNAPNQVRPPVVGL